MSSNIMARALQAPHRPPTISHRPNRKMYEARLLLTPSPPPPTQLTSEQMMRTCRHEPSVHQVHIEARPLACACEASHNPPSTSSPHSAAFKIFPVRPMFFPPPTPHLAFDNEIYACPLVLTRPSCQHMSFNQEVSDLPPHPLLPLQHLCI